MRYIIEIFDHGDPVGVVLAGNDEKVARDTMKALPSSDGVTFLRLSQEADGVMVEVDSERREG